MARRAAPGPPGALWALALLGAVRGQQQVRWRISIAWEDESCNSVCQGFGQKCTEECWPATSQGLLNAVSTPALDGTCFAVEEGMAAAIHPAKDPANTVCYSNAGNPTSYRCPMVPSTPPARAATGHFIRRLCPCVNSTASAPACGLGAEPAAPAPSGAYAAPTPAPSAPGPAPTPAPAAPAPTPAPALAPPAAAWQGPQGCQVLCVSGFTHADATLNGRYSPVGTSVRLFYWEHLSAPDVVLAHADERWQFFRGREPASGVPIGAARLRTAVGSGVPSGGPFDTADGDSLIDFQCCTVSPESSGASSGSAEPDDEADAPDLATIIPAIAAAAAACGALGVCGCLVWLCRRRRPSRWFRSRPYATMSAPEARAPPDLRAEGEEDPRFFDDNFKLGSPAKSLRAHVEKPTAGAVALGTPVTHPWGSAAPAPHGGGPARAVPGAPGAFGLGARPPGDDRAAAAVAAVLGRGLGAAATVGPGGVYEGPVNPWWDAGRGGAAAPVHFEVGQEVRLRGLGLDPTWNDAEGEVEDVDARAGLVRVRLPDGRAKAVRAEQCEAIGAAPGRGVRAWSDGPAEGPLPRRPDGLNADGGSPSRRPGAGARAPGGAGLQTRPGPRGAAAADAGTTIGRTAGPDPGAGRAGRGGQPWAGRAQLPPLAAGAPARAAAGPRPPHAPAPEAADEGPRRQRAAGAGWARPGDRNSSAAATRSSRSQNLTASGSFGLGVANPKEDELLLDVQAHLSNLTSRMADPILR